MYIEGNSGRAVGRILGIGKNMCLYWIKKYAKEIELENAANEREKVIEMNELYSYVERKKQNICDNISKQKKRQIVGYDIAYYKSSERIQRLLDKSPKTEHYYSDAYSVYSEICYYVTHISLKTKVRHTL